MECFDLEIGGVEDHVHILCLLLKKKTLIELMEELKKRSSKWIKTQGAHYEQSKSHTVAKLIKLGIPLKKTGRQKIDNPFIF